VRINEVHWILEGKKMCLVTDKKHQNQSEKVRAEEKRRRRRRRR